MGSLVSPALRARSAQPTVRADDAHPAGRPAHCAARPKQTPAPEAQLSLLRMTCSFSSRGSLPADMVHFQHPLAFQAIPPISAATPAAAKTRRQSSPWFVVHHQGAAIPSTVQPWIHLQPASAACNIWHLLFGSNELCEGLHHGLQHSHSFVTSTSSRS